MSANGAIIFTEKHETLSLFKQNPLLKAHILKAHILCDLCSSTKAWIFGLITK